MSRDAWIVLAWLAGVVAAALLLAELLLQPTSTADRLHLVEIIVIPALAAAVMVPVLRRWVGRRSSVAGAALAVGLCSLAVGAISASAASNAMFVSDHDFRLFIVVLALACGIALVVGAALSRPLAADIARLGEVATRVADGDLAARTGIDRGDEVGAAARAVDEMVVSLGEAAAGRAGTEAARRQLLANIGHDVRTPLSAMRAAVESLQDGMSPDPVRYLAVLGTQLDHVEALLDQFVEFARIESGAAGQQREAVSLTELAHEAIEASTPLADRLRVGLRLEADGPGTVHAAPLEMSRVVRNLLENAVRYSPIGARVTTRVEEGDGVTLAVLDEGPGFPAEFVAHAFEPFARADPARDVRTGHAGLGLAISRALIEAHDGRIWIGDSTHGAVHVWLPSPASTLAARNGWWTG
jgi:signal transduction histidine kinase